MRFRRKRQRSEKPLSEKSRVRNEDASPNHVIDLTGSDDDDENELPTLVAGSTRKRLSSQLGASFAAKRAKKEEIHVDEESCSEDENDSDDEVEILDSTTLFPSPLVATAQMNDNADDDEIAVVGMKNHVELSHMRQHCTKFPFADNPASFCSGCFCYVCDVKVDECTSWEQHCHATDQGPQAAQWNNKRAVSRSKAQGIALPPSSSRGSTFGSLLATFRTNLGSIRRQYQTPEPASRAMNEMNRRIIMQGMQPTRGVFQGLGPFPPTLEAKQRHDLTECRYCHQYSNLSRRRHADFRHGRVLHPVPLLQWCLSCGRVASAEPQEMLPPKKRFVPANKDIHLGTKEIKFRLHVHDPREMAEFKDKWQQHANEWNYDKSQMEKDLFHHRVTAHPVIREMIGLLSPFGSDDIPADGCLTKQLADTDILAAECDALILEDPNDALLLDKLDQLSQSTVLGHTLSATWDDAASMGTLTLNAYIANTALEKTNTGNNDMALFLGLWFGIFPCPFTDLKRAVKEGVVSNVDLQPSTNVGWWKDEDNTFDLEKEMVRAWKDWECDHPKSSQQSDEVDGQLVRLSPSVPGLGGVCPTGHNLETILKNFFSECLPDDLSCREKSIERLAGHVAGLRLEHRPVLRFENAFSQRPSIKDHNSLLGSTRDAVMYPLRYSGSKITLSKVKSLTALLSHTENLCHAPAPFVAGLTVELLPFQLQSLQWAIERETIPGGVQSVHWAKIPLPANSQNELYFNPMLGMFSDTKPNCVRGGWICEQMGMGKTVISLALILSNPAPALPKSGARTTDLCKAPKPVNGQAFWNPHSTANETLHVHPKRGKYLSRGTLVVCNVSLVGQWIEEAKSKLEDPGLVYSYHGANRKRDPKILAKNAIVVTTYETLASDSNYHAQKAKDSSYCPPIEQIRWWRCICDESHVLRTPTAKSQAVMNILADNKWLVSGTPINTSLNDITNQLTYLGIKHPRSIVTCFRDSVGKAIGLVKNLKELRRMIGRQGGAQCIGKFTWFMRSVMMRHSQEMKYSNTDTTLMSLPEKEETILSIDFTPEDKQEYALLEEKAKMFYRTFDRRLASKAYLKLTSSLLPLRVACAGGRIPLDEAAQNDEAETRDINGTSDDEEEDDLETGKKTTKAARLSEYAFKSKLERLIEEMTKIRDEEPDSKMLIFSQFATTLNWLQQELPKHKFQFRTLAGDMTMSKRAKALRDFQNDPPTTIFLLSMRAGAVGINLTAANRVFLLEPCFNPSLEAQAIGRVWRLGQTRPVKIYRLTMKDSVEERMRTMLEKKYGGNTQSQAKTSVGSLKTDKAKMVAEEFDLLFGIENKPLPVTTEPDDIPLPDGAVSSGFGI